MSQLGVALQEPASRDRTILCFLGEQMDASDEPRPRRRTLKERLGLKGVNISCCGASWSLGTTVENDEESEEEEEERHVVEAPVVCSDPDPPVTSGMNLAAALAAERRLRATNERESETRSESPRRVSLMRLLEESEKVGNDWVCCVCMGRKKGAAFIPCGHTFCRVCSRELWLNRGSCPLCNRPILEILDIF